MNGVTPPDSPIAGVFHGHDGVREWQRLTNEVFAELRFWPKEIIEAPDGRVLAICHARARGRESDVVVEVPFAHVIELRDGKAVAFRCTPKSQTLEPPSDSLAELRDELTRTAVAPREKRQRG